MKKDIGIEFFIVTIVCAVLALIILIAFKPQKKISEIRDIQRAGQAEAIINALFKCVFDNNGAFPDNFKKMESESYYMIGNGNDASGCIRRDTVKIIDLGFGNCQGEKKLAPDYISLMPIESIGEEWSEKKTGFYIMKSVRGRVVVGACSAEDNFVEILK